MNISLCPECGSPAEPLDSKYAGCLCDSCLEKITDSTGRPVECFLENPPHNGFVAFYKDTKNPIEEKCVEVTDFHRAFIGENKYWVGAKATGYIVAYPGLARS